jgi:hypothetical protein
MEQQVQEVVHFETLCGRASFSLQTSDWDLEA